MKSGGTEIGFPTWSVMLRTLESSEVHSLLDRNGYVLVVKAKRASLRQLSKDLKPEIGEAVLEARQRD